MKYFLITLLILFCQFTYSQNDSTNISMAGLHLEKFSSSASNGVAMQIIGVGIIAGANFAESDNRRELITIGGAIVTGAGMVVLLNSFKHLKKASKGFQKVKPASEGIGIAIGL